MSEEGRLRRVAERMFPAPIDHGIAQTDRAVCNVRSGTTSHQAGRGRRRRGVVRGRGAIGEKAVQPIVVYPPTAASRRKAIRSSRSRSACSSTWISGSCWPTGSIPTILAIEDAHQRGRVGAEPDRTRRRRCPRLAARELSQGHQGLRVVGRPGLRRDPRSADLRQQHHLAVDGRPHRRAGHRLDRCAPVRQRLLLHRGQRRHPHRRRDVRQLAVPEGASRRSACSGKRDRPAATTPTTSATRRCSSG